MKILLVFLFCSIASIQAGSCEGKYRFKIQGKDKIFCIEKEMKSLVNIECTKKKCDSLKILSSPKLKNVRLSTSELAGGKNPSTLLCKKINGQLIFAKSEFGHEQFFCQFKDKSMISTNSLMVKYEDIKANQ
ncbi:MAG: hypothetical protein GY909_13745 [Oligoflexia bacterium]|nr:hypothetical protein [Oligoflexia bacterium]